MPAFDDAICVPAPLEEVWLLVHDPSRFPDWWAGIERTQVSSPEDGSAEAAPGVASAAPASGPSGTESRSYTMWPQGSPDFPMGQRLRTSSADGRVTISCLVFDLEFTWRLRPADGDPRQTEVQVHVEIPQPEAARLATQRELIAASLQRLAEVASGSPLGDSR